MVVGQYISRKKLFKSSSKKRDNILVKAFGFTYEELGDLRSSDITEEHLVTVAEAIYEKTNDPISVTSLSVAAVGSPIWEGNRTHWDYGSRISQTYKEKRDKILTEKDLRVTCTHLLRKDADAYNGNLEETAPLWGVKPSDDDWLRSVRLPEHLNLDYDTSQLLGVIWADGIPSYSKGKYPSVILSGLESDKCFYECILKPRIKKIFNYNTQLMLLDHKEGVKARLRERDVVFGNTKTPRLILSSYSIAQFLHSLDFPKNKKENIELPHSDLEKFSYNKKAFFDGIISGMGSLKKGSKARGSFNLMCGDRDSTFIENLHSLAEELGYKPSVIYDYAAYHKDESSHRFNISTERSKKIRLINPRHII